MTVENGGGSAEAPKAPDYSGLLEKVAEIIDAKLAPVQSIVDESKNKTQRRNEDLASQLKAERERREGLEAKIREAGLADGGTVDEGLSLLNAQFGQLRKDYEEQQGFLKEIQDSHRLAKSELRRKELEELVLGDVASDAREDGRYMIDGYLKNKGIALDETQDLGELAQAMRTRFHQRLSVRSDGKGPSPAREQPGASVDLSKITWGDYRKYHDVPKEIRHLIPPDEFKRMEKPPNGGGKGGLAGLGV